MKHRIIISIIILITFYSCRKEFLDIEHFRNYPVKFAKQKVTYPNNQFEIYVPHNWEITIHDDDDDEQQFEIGMKAVSKSNEVGFTNTVAIKREKSLTNQNEIAIEIDSIINQVIYNEDYEILETSNLTINDIDAIGIHYTSNHKEYGYTEGFEIILPSKFENYNYHLIASGSKTQEFDIQMSMMVQCLMTFEEIK